MNYIIIFATGIIIKAPKKIIRTLVASSIGSVYAVLSYISVLEICSSTFLKIILSIAMVYIAFKPLNIKLFFKEFIIFYLTSFTFGGVAFALLYFVSPQNILMEKRCVNWYISNKNCISRRNGWIYYYNNSI
jgi:stage II sporulation protein GA (sporulation sigma-E factor processing peptidase)